MSLKISNETITKFNSIVFKPNFFGLLRGELVLPSSHIVSIIVHNVPKEEKTGEELHLYNLEDIYCELTVLLDNQIVHFEIFESDIDYKFGNWEGIPISKVIEKLQIILDILN